MNPPNVYELTIPNSQRTRSTTAIVQSIGSILLLSQNKPVRDSKHACETRLPSRNSLKYPVDLVVLGADLPYLGARKYPSGRSHLRFFTYDGLVDLDDSVSDCVKRQIRHGVQVEFPHEISAVGFRCFDAQIERHSDFFAGLALGKKLDHFPLAWG